MVSEVGCMREEGYVANGRCLSMKQRSN
jgi:hypothetical protein